MNTDKIRLMTGLVQSNTVQQLMDLAYTLLENPLCLVITKGQLLAYSQIYGEHQTRWTELRNHAPTDVRGTDCGNGISLIEAQDDISWLKKAIVNNGVHEGYLFLSSMFRPFDIEDRAVFDMVTVLVTNLMHGSGFGANHFKNIIIKLINKEPCSQEEIAPALAESHLRNYEYFHVLCFNEATASGHFSAGSPGQGSEQFQQRFRALFNLLDKLPCSETLSLDQNFICIYGAHNRVSNWYSLIPGFRELVFETRCSVGISPAFSELSQLRQKFEQAKLAMEYGSQIGNGGLCPYEHFGLFHLLEQFSTHSTAEDLCSARVLTLRDYDQANGTEFLRTLEVFLRCNRSYQEAASKLKIHRNTVVYRINKCREICQMTLDQEFDTFFTQYSIRVLDCLPHLHKTDIHD